jgi:hypothetical protein
MSDSDVPAQSLALIEVIAAAIRAAPGDEIDAYPGHSAPEQADPINRAFMAAVRSLPEAGPGSDGSRAVSVSHALRRVAERRLTAEGFDAGRVRLLIDSEPGGPDDWRTFLILSSRTQIEDALRDMETDLA